MKTERKMMIRAFTKIAKQWGDSKDNPNFLRRYGYKNARAWGRSIADTYYRSEHFHCSLAIAYEHAAIDGRKITQKDFDEFAMEELSCW